MDLARFFLTHPIACTLTLWLGGCIGTAWFLSALFSHGKRMLAYLNEPEPTPTPEPPPALTAEPAFVDKLQRHEAAILAWQAEPRSVIHLEIARWQRDEALRQQEIRMGLRLMKGGKV